MLCLVAPNPHTDPTTPSPQFLAAFKKRFLGHHDAPPKMRHHRAPSLSPRALDLARSARCCPDSQPTSSLLNLHIYNTLQHFPVPSWASTVPLGALVQMTFASAFLVSWPDTKKALPIWIVWDLSGPLGAHPGHFGHLQGHLWARHVLLWSPPVLAWASTVPLGALVQ